MPKLSNESAVSPEARKALGQRIDIVARAVGSRAEAAATAGITVQHLGLLIKGGTSGPSAVSLARLCAATGYSLDWLMSGTGPEKRDPASLEARLTQRAAGDPEAAATMASALEMARRQVLLLQRLESALKEMYGGLTEKEESLVLSPAIDLIAPDNQVPPNWEPLAHMVIETHRAAIAIAESRADGRPKSPR